MKNNNWEANSLTEENLYINTYEAPVSELNTEIELSLSGTNLKGTLQAFVDDNSFKTSKIVSICVEDDQGNIKQGLIHVFSNPQKKLVKELKVVLGVEISEDVSNWELTQKKAQLFNLNDDGTDLNDIISKLEKILKKIPNYKSYSYQVLESLLKMSDDELDSYIFSDTQVMKPQDPKQHGGVILMF